MQEHSSEVAYEYMRKSIAVIIGAILLLGVIFSNIYIASEYVHDCTGEECPICHTISECEAFISRVSSCLAIFAVTILTIICLLGIVLVFGKEVLCKTPVSMKVRLNN